MVLTLAIVGIAGLAQGLDERGSADRARFVGHGGVASTASSSVVRATRASPSDQPASLATSSGGTAGRRPARPRDSSASARFRISGDLVPCKRLQDGHAAAGEQGRVDLERGVLGRGADERDRSLLDGVQEGILLGLVEAVDLVDEEDDPAAAAADLGGLVDCRADFLDPRKDRGEGDESGLGARAIRRANVVLPVPGGPQRISEGSFPRAAAPAPAAIRCRPARPDPRIPPASAAAFVRPAEPRQTRLAFPLPDFARPPARRTVAPSIPAACHHSVPKRFRQERMPRFQRAPLLWYLGTVRDLKENTTPARKFRILAHTNPTRQRGECLRALAGASG